MLTEFSLLESLDQVYPLQRIVPKLKAFIFDEWEFDIGSQIHSIRFSRLPVDGFGRKVCKIEFGLKRGKQIRKKITGIPNIRKYLATVINAIETSLETKTPELERKSDGIVITMDSDVFSRHGKIFMRVMNRRFRKKLKFHDSYFTIPGDDEISGVYAWKRERSFKSVFTNIDMSVEEPKEIIDFDVVKDPATSFADVNQKKKISAVLSIKDMIVSKLADTVVKLPPEPIPTPKSFTKEEIVSDVEKIRLAKKRPHQNLLEDVVIDEKSLLQLLIVTTFFRNSIKTETNKTDTIFQENNLLNHKITINDKTLRNFIAADLKKYSTESFLSSAEYSLALNLEGIETEYVWGTRKNGWGSLSSTFKGYFTKAGVPSSVIENLQFKPPRDDVSFADVMKVIDNAESILKKNGVIVDKSIKHYALKPIEKEWTTISEIQSLSSSKETRIALLNDIIASIPESLIDNYDHYQYEESKKKTKIVKKLKYTYEEPILSLVSNATDLIDSVSETPEEFARHVDRLPAFAQQLYSEDLEIFKTSWISNWSLSGNSTAQLLAHKATSDIFVNSQLNDFWHHESQNDTVRFKAFDVLKSRYENHFVKIYEDSQQFYRSKYKKKYSGLKLRLYRGIGKYAVDTYIPGALESWTVDVSTAHRFGKMMSTDRNKNYTILVAEVPIEHILGCWQSLGQAWPGEENLKGKKEFIVMGGTFASTPIYVYDSAKKIGTTQLKTFKEWFNLYESKVSKGDAVKIVTPSMNRFGAILKSPTSALGNDPKESELRDNKVVDKSTDL